MEASHGKEEKRKESGKEKEKEESVRKEREKEVVEEICKKSGQEEVRPKEGETQRKGGQEGRNAGSNNGGIGGPSPLRRGGAGGGGKTPPPPHPRGPFPGVPGRKGVGGGLRSVRGSLCPGLDRGHSSTGVRIGPSSCLVS